MSDDIWKSLYLSCVNDDFNKAKNIFTNNSVSVMRGIINKVKCGWTCLDQTISWKNQKMVALLLSYGAQTVYYNDKTTGSTKEKWDWYIQYISTLSVVQMEESLKPVNTKFNSALAPQSFTQSGSDSDYSRPTANTMGMLTREEQLATESARLERIASSGAKSFNVPKQSSVPAVVSNSPKPSVRDPGAVERARQLEAEREAERIKQEEIDKKFGVKYGNQNTNVIENVSAPYTSNEPSVGADPDLEEKRLLKALSAKGAHVPVPKKSATELAAEREAWKKQQEAKMFSSGADEEVISLPMPKRNQSGQYK
jgi:hypothetical protein